MAEDVDVGKPTGFNSDSSSSASSSSSDDTEGNVPDFTQDSKSKR